MKFSPLVESLIEALRILPGVGPKTAQRMALHILERDRDGATRLAHSLIASCEQVGQCVKCRNLTESNLCQICESPKRETGIICVVESPVDVIAIEQSGSFSGRYFVLQGHLSPIEGIGPKDIGIDQLEALLEEGNTQELILATNPTVEGEATAHFISERAKKYNAKVSRIAHGVPLGGELEYVDGGTLSHAFTGRRTLV